MPAATTAGTEQRARILDAALALMSEHGVAASSMRQLASACNLNVATIYHYFPSKADLLRSVIDERRYGERLQLDRPPIDLATPPRERLADLLSWLWANALEEQAVWRLLIGESIRGEAAATASASAVVEALAVALEQWLADGFPELREDPGAVARVVRGQVFSLVVEHLAVGAITRTAARQRAEDLAGVVFPAVGSGRPGRATLPS